MKTLNSFNPLIQVNDFYQKRKKLLKPWKKKPRFNPLIQVNDFYPVWKKRLLGR